MAFENAQGSTETRKQMYEKELKAGKPIDDILKQVKEPIGAYESIGDKKISIVLNKPVPETLQGSKMRLLKGKVYLGADSEEDQEQNFYGSDGGAQKMVAQNFLYIGVAVSLVIGVGMGYLWHKYVKK